MNYNSTRNAALQVTAAQAIAQGISEEGGLFVPQSFPKADLNDMLGLDYIGRALATSIPTQTFALEEAKKEKSRAYHRNLPVFLASCSPWGWSPSPGTPNPSTGLSSSSW